jgi:hypothetical protein
MGRLLFGFSFFLLIYFRFPTVCRIL